MYALNECENQSMPLKKKKNTCALYGDYTWVTVSYEQSYSSYYIHYTQGGDGLSDFLLEFLCAFFDTLRNKMGRP